jgi:hypothetical protein
MLRIVVPGEEFFNEEKQEFFTKGDVTLELEHSLVSLSKWESIFEKPFLSSGEKTDDEALRYIECMIVTPDFPPNVVSKLSEENIEQINQYVGSKQSAAWFRDTPTRAGSSEAITAEIIYYWMTVFNIPFECEKWHLNRLFTLIRVCNAKQQKPKKMSRAEQVARQRELNAMRRAQLGTRG